MLKPKSYRCYLITVQWNAIVPRGSICWLERCAELMYSLIQIPNIYSFLSYPTSLSSIFQHQHDYSLIVLHHRQWNHEDENAYSLTPDGHSTPFESSPAWEYSHPSTNFDARPNLARPVQTVDWEVICFVVREMSSVLASVIWQFLFPYDVMMVDYDHVLPVMRTTVICPVVSVC